jgi:protein TonB
MYANQQYRSGINAGSLAAAVAVNAGVIGALLLSAPVIEAIRQRTVLRVENIPLAPPPPEIIKPETPRTAAENSVVTPPERPDTSMAVTSTASSEFALPPLPLPPLPPIAPGGETATASEPPVSPVLVEARPDPRFARDMQPAYPAGERRAEREGMATVRVTIGTDGKILAAECVAATNEAFCRATRSQALAKWRFRPATRDGVAVETTREMTVRFQLES